MDRALPSHLRTERSSMRPDRASVFSTPNPNRAQVERFSTIIGEPEIPPRYGHCNPEQLLPERIGEQARESSTLSLLDPPRGERPGLAPACSWAHSTESTQKSAVLDCNQHSVVD